MIIPDSFPTNVPEAVEAYANLGFCIHPCNGPKEGRGSARGKKPRFSGWMDWTLENLTDEIRRKHFLSATQSNIGHVVRPPLVVVDLDSKPDEGASVMAWLDEQPDLAEVPRERTGGGVHLWFRCLDLPEFRSKRGTPYHKNLVSQLTGAVTAELIHRGNVILSPSQHASGHVYRWEVGGEVPEIEWARLQDIFGFVEPDAGESNAPGPGRPRKAPPWWARWKGDLTTLDIVALARECGLYGELLDADTGRHSIRCPWQKEHSDRGEGWTPRSTDSVIFEASDGRPGFHCLHSHCDERGLPELLAHIEDKSPGLVDRHCQVEREWRTGQRSADGVRPRILLPGSERPDSVFAGEIASVVGSKRAWFGFADNVVLLSEPTDTEILGGGLGARVLKPVEAITEVESHAEIGFLRKDESGGLGFVAHSMSEATARVLLSSPQLRGQLPGIRRLLDVPLPVFSDGAIVYPLPGYDSRFRTFLAPNAPEIEWMGVEEARTLLIDEVFGNAENGGFCWKDDQALCHAVARLLTPFCRGLMDWARTPLFIYESNRERCGKDFLAHIAALVHVGRKVVYAPPGRDSDQELRKVITSALIACAQIIHFSNVKGHLRSAALEAATDNSGVWRDRMLGGNTEVSVPNLAEYSFSANAGTTWEPDIEGRARRIALQYDKEQINARRFRHPDLHEFVMRKRSAILSALAALVAEWDRQGRPEGPTPFASFPQWGRIVGGIMHACDLGDPCLPHTDSSAVTGDLNTESMKAFFALAAERFGDECVKKPAIFELIRESQDDGIFDWIDVDSRSGKTTLGKLLSKFAERELGGIKLTMPPRGRNNLEYRFTRIEELGEEGTSCTSGTSRSAQCIRDNSNSECVGITENGGISTIYSGKEEVHHVHHVPAPVTSPEAFERLAEEIMLADGPVALDIETFGTKGKGALSPYAPGAEIRLLSVSLPGRSPVIIDLRACGYDLGPLRGALEASEVVAHNAKFDLLWLREKCGLNPRRVFCTMTAARLLTAGSKQPNDLGSVLVRHLGVHLPKDQGRSNWGAESLSREQLDYASSDVAFLHGLRAKLDEELDAARLRETADLEMALLPVVVDIEAEGFPVDEAHMQAIHDQAEADAEVAAARAREALGDINLNSPAQVSGAFLKLGVDLPDTGAETLADVNHPAARALLGYRGQEKLRQQAASLLKALRTDGRIHARFEPTGADTGRFSSREPNLQNIAVGPLREAFAAPPGMALIVADYSQVELRGAAAIAGDETLLELCREGKDVHRRTAALILGKDETEVSSEDRRTAKATNFGLIYGQSAKGLVRYARSSYGVELTLDEATVFRTRFFASYRGLAAWHKRAWRSAGEIGGLPDCEVRTRLGRRRLLARGGEDWPRFSALVNNPVQGTCADGMKAAILRLGRELAPDARMVATVHDELVVLVPAERAEEVRIQVVTAMREEMERFFPEVPIEVDSKVCGNWSEK